MNIKKSIFFGLILISFLLPFVAIAQAQQVPKYVGINEGATYTWKTEFDKGPLQTYYEDAGLSETIAGEAADYEFDLYGFNEKTEGWKVYIVDLYPERDEKLYGKEYSRVKFIYNWYKTKASADPDAWKKIDKYETSTIYEPNEDLWLRFIKPSMPVYLDYGMGAGIASFFLPKDLKFKDIVGELSDQIDDHNWDDNFDADINTVEVQYFLSQKVVGISTEFNYKDTSDTQSFKSISKYTDDGILYYYEYSYDGDIIVKLELGTIGGVYLIENLWWIAIVAGAVIVSVIVGVVILIVKRKNK